MKVSESGGEEQRGTTSKALEVQKFIKSVMNQETFFSAGVDTQCWSKVSSIQFRGFYCFMKMLIPFSCKNLE